MSASDNGRCRVITAVEEQLRAFDFEEESEYEEFPGIESCFHRSSEGVVNTTEEVVVIVRLQDPDVESVNEVIDRSKWFFDWKVVEGIDVMNRRWVYTLLVLDSASGPVRTAVKRNVGKFDDGFILPVIATMGGESLVYERPGSLQQLGIHKKLSENAKQYFKPLSDS